MRQGWDKPFILHPETEQNPVGLGSFFYRAYLRKNRLALLACIFLGFLVSLTGVLFPVLLGGFYQSSLGVSNARNALFGFTSLFGENASTILYLMGLLLLLRLLAAYLNNYLSARFSNSIVTAIKTDLFARQIESEPNRFAVKAIENNLSAYGGNLQSIKQFIEKGIVQFCADLLFLACACIMLCLLSAKLCMIIALTCIVAQLAIVVIQASTRNAYLKAKKKERSNFGFVQKAFESYRSNWMLNKNTLYPGRFIKEIGKLTAIHHSIARSQAFISAIARVLPYTAIFAMMLWMVVFQAKEEMERPALVIVFFMLTINIGYVLRRVSKVKVVWDKGMYRLNTIAKWIGAKEATRDAASSLDYAGKNAQQLMINQLDAGTGSLINLNAEVNGRYEIWFGSRKALYSFSMELLSANLDSATAVYIDGKKLQKAFAYEARRSIVFASPIFPLRGRSIGDSLAYSARNFKGETAQRFFTTLGIACPNFDALLNTSESDYRELFILQMCRAFLSKKPFVFLDEALDYEFEIKHPQLHAKILEQFSHAAIIRLKTQLNHDNTLFVRSNF